MNRNLRSHSIILCLLTVVVSALCSCASGQQIPPQGGPRDTIPPTILSTVPAPSTTNFSGETVEIDFDEYLPEGDLSRLVVITPIPVIPPKIAWSGTTLEIDFQEPLKENRTYTVTLASSIADKAGNRLGTPYSLRFSTGDKIDSGRIVGEIIGRSRLATAYVYAYRLNDLDIAAGIRIDSITADFIAPISDDGRFSLEGMPTGQYRLLAIADAAADGRYTPGEDAVGLYTGDITLSSQETPIENIRIRLAAAPDDLNPPSLYSATPVSAQRTDLRFSEPIDTASLRWENFVLSTAGRELRVLDIWRSAGGGVGLLHEKIPQGAEVDVRVNNVRDTAGNAIIDTLRTAKFTADNAVDSLAPILIPGSIDTLRPYTPPDSIVLHFNEPVRYDGNGDGIVQLRDTTDSSLTIRFRLQRRSAVELVAYPLDTLFDEPVGILVIAHERLRDEADNTPDSALRITMRVAPARQNGRLEGSIIDSAAPESKHVLVLRDRTTGQTITRGGLRAGAWSMSGVPEGEYDVSVFRDNDGDGIYDYGTVVPWQPAEAYVQWRGSVRVRPRWTTNQINIEIPRRD